MFCSLCLNHQKKGIKLPCNHHLCFKCFPQIHSSQNPIQYQCQTCFQVHSINLQTHLPQQNSYFQSSQKEPSMNHSESQQNIFCWTCCKLISIKQYIKGIHRQHKVQTIEEAFPQIKNLMLEQLQKSLTLKDYLEQTKMSLQTNILKKQYSDLMKKITEFFDKQMQIVQCTKQNVLHELEIHYSKSLKQINKDLQFIHPVMMNVSQIEQKISAFLTDQAPITILNPLSQIIIQLDHFNSKVKEKKMIIPQLPVFIVKSGIKDAIESAFQLFTKNQAQSQISNEKRAPFKHKENSFEATQSKLKFSIKSSIKQEGQSQPRKLLNPNSALNKRVKLVQKVKGKMKYSSGYCLTTFS